MINMDAINGAFELVAAAFVLNHCRVLRAQKCVRGLSVVSVVFFFCWGVWNVVYYPSLGQWLSFAGGVVLMLCNSLYVGMLLHYREGRPWRVVLRDWWFEFQWRRMCAQMNRAARRGSK